LKKEEEKFIERSHNKFYQMTKEFNAVCPNCKSIRIYSRKRKTPKYICERCHNEFDNPKIKIFYKTQKQNNDLGEQYSNPDE
jgi:DNA-directed RNA polymerase subunit M/transcription elongation factor TFIIS